MIRFLRRLKAAWLYARVAPYIEAADAEEFWTDNDATNLSRFFDSHSGRKLKLRLSNFTIKAACDAVNRGGDYARNTGIAAGVGIGIGAIEEHFTSGVTNNAESELPEELTALDVLAQEEAV